jgi:hypothetical protein
MKRDFNQGGKLFILFLLLTLGLTSYASIGDDRGKNGKNKPSSTSSTKVIFTMVGAGSFTLKSSISYRGSVLSTNAGKIKRYSLYDNSIVVQQKGSTFYVSPYGLRYKQRTRKIQILSNVRLLNWNINIPK